VAFALAAVTAFTVVRLRTASTARPAAPEFVLAAIEAVAPAAILCGAFFVVYGIVDLFVWALSYTSLGWNSDHEARRVASLFALALVPTFTYITLESVRKKLYPPVAGVPSRYHAYVARDPGRLAVGAAFALLVPAGAIAYLLVAGVSSLWAVAGLAAYTAFASVAASPPGEREEPGHASGEVVGRLERAFAAAGYAVVRQPRTGEPEIDPLLVDVDLLAQKEDRCVVVEIKRGGADARPLSWTDGTRVATAARVLEFDFPPISSAESSKSALRGKIAHMDPVLVLVDVAADPSLKSFAKNERVTILSIRTAQREASVAYPASDDLREVGREYVALLHGESPAEATRGAVVAG